jgi:hypothetical protein
LLERSVFYRTSTAGRAHQALVVKDHDVTILSHLAIELDDIYVRLYRLYTSESGVFRIFTRRAAMRNLLICRHAIGLRNWEEVSTFWLRRAGSLTDSAFNGRFEDE